MIEKLDIKDYENKEQLVWFGVINKLNQLVDAVNGILAAQEQYATIYNEDIVPMLTPENEEPETPAKNVQDDHYWFKQQERYKAALVLIRDLTGGGMSYHDIVIEMREIAKWALDPYYKPLLIGRYNKETSELLDILRETKGGDNE